MSPLRGEVWNTNRTRLNRVLVISGGMYNSLPDVANILALPVIADPFPGGWTVAVSSDEVAIVDRITPFRKSWLTTRHLQADSRTLTDANNALFKILATD